MRDAAEVSSLVLVLRTLTFLVQFARSRWLGAAGREAQSSRPRLGGKAAKLTLGGLFRLL